MLLTSATAMLSTVQLTTAALQSGPWETALSRFLEDLEPDERIIFDSATVQNIHNSASKMDGEGSRRSRIGNVKRSIDRLSAKMEDYAKAFDPLSNVPSRFLAPIWGGIRVVLVMVENVTRLYDKVVEALGGIGESLPQFSVYQKLCLPDQYGRLAQLLADAYLDVFQMCVTFRRLLENRGTKCHYWYTQVLTSGPVQKLDSTVKAFRKRRKEIDQEVGLSHQPEATGSAMGAKEIDDLIEMDDKAEARERCRKFPPQPGGKNSVHKDLESALLSAVKANDLEVVKVLIKGGADVNGSNTQGPKSLAPLLVACIIGHQRMVELLLAHQANVNVRTQGSFKVDIEGTRQEIAKGSTPLLIAHWTGNDAIFLMLRRAGGDIGAVDKKGRGLSEIRLLKLKAARRLEARQMPTTLAISTDEIFE